MCYIYNDFEGSERPGKRYFTLREASRYLGVNKSLLLKEVKDGKIAHYKPYESTMSFHVNDLENWMGKKRVPTEYELLISSMDTI